MIFKCGYFLPNATEITKAVAHCRQLEKTRKTFFECVYNMETGLFRYIEHGNSQTRTVLKPCEIRLDNSTGTGYETEVNTPDYVRAEIIKKAYRKRGVYR